VEEKVVSSTPVMRAPRETGKLDDTCWIFMSWRTTDLRSPCASAEPSSEVNFFCWTASMSIVCARQCWFVCIYMDLHHMGAALTDRLERVARRGPRALRLGEAEVVERGADGDDEVALERVLRRRDAVGVALAERGVSGSGLGEDCGGVGALNLRLVGADRHLCCCTVGRISVF